MTDREKRTIHFVKSLENNTSTLVALYEYVTGRIVQLEPTEKTDDHDIEKCHIINKETFARLKEDGVCLWNCAVPYDGKAIGRNGTKLTYLFWAENPSQQVYLRNASF